MTAQEVFLKHIHVIASAALAACSASALAQSTASRANEQRCQTLQQEVQQSYQQAVQARLPKQDPGSYTQDAYDVKGIMSTDVTPGFGKLLQLDFSGVINSLVNQGMTKAQQRGQQTFASRMNGVLGSLGAGTANFQGVTTTASAPLSMATPSFVNTGRTPAATAPTANPLASNPNPVFRQLTPTLQPDGTFKAPSANGQPTYTGPYGRTYVIQ